MKTDGDIKLRTIQDLSDAHEWLINKQRKGEIDSKTADAMNTTLMCVVLAWFVLR